MVSIQVVSRTVDAAGAIQYQFDDGSGVVFPDAAAEASSCLDSAIELQMRANMVQIAVCKTVHGMANVTVTLNVDDANGNVLTVA